MLNKKFVKGTMVLAVAGLVAKFLGIFFKIPLQRLIHDEGMGLFGLPYPIYNLMLSISIIGLPTAISKLIAEKIAIGDYRGVKKVFRVSFVMMICIGIFSSCFLYFGTPYFIRLLDWPQESYYSIIGLSFAPFFVSIMSSFRGYFQGMQIMTPTAVSQMVEQLGRVFIGVGLAYIYIDRGIGYAAGVASFGATAGAALGALLLILYYLKAGKYLIPSSSYKIQKSQEKIVDIIKSLTWVAIPVTLGAALSSVMGLIDAIIVPSRLLEGGYTIGGATVLYGRLTGKAVTLMNVPLTFSMALATSLVPAISEANRKSNKVELEEKIKTSIKITIIIALPATIGLSLLASPIIGLLWGKGEAGGDILRVLAFNVLFISLAQTFTSILQGIDKIFIPVRNLLVGIIIKVIISHFLLVTVLNILGAVAGSICGYGTVMILNYRAIKKAVPLEMSIKKIVFKPLFSSIFMAIVVMLTFHYSFNYFVREEIATVMAVFWGMIFYAMMIFLTKTIDFNKRNSLLK